MKPMYRNCRNGAFLLVALACLGAVSGCATMKSWWPWHAAPPAAPQPVRELNVNVPADMAMPVVLQFWERNTLVLDLQQVPATGQFMLTREGDKAWPVRIAFRMSPSRFETLQVRGAQRIVLPLSTAGDGVVQAELPASAYDKDTKSLQVSWGSRASF
jgi:hypothetical protein